MVEMSRNKKVNLFLGCFFLGNVMLLFTGLARFTQTSSDGGVDPQNEALKTSLELVSRQLMVKHEEYHRNRVVASYQGGTYGNSNVNDKDNTRQDEVTFDKNIHNIDVTQEEHTPVLEAPKSAPRRNNPPALIGEDTDPDQIFQVPNIVHYIWYNHQHAPLQFHHMLSVKAASKFLKPDHIYFHTDNEPNGTYWEMVKTLPNFKVMKREPPWELFGEKVKEPFYYTSHSNVDRIKVLMEYGGVYFDFDFVALQSFNELRKQVCVIGWESDHQACGSVIVASKDSFFLTLWINAYLDDYRIEEWAYNTGKVPFNLARRFPHLCHSEKTTLNRPSFKELDLIYEEGNKSWDWRTNYGVHLWYRLWKEGPLFKGVEPNENNVKTLDSPFGEIARTILYNTSEIIK